MNFKIPYNLLKNALHINRPTQVQLVPILHSSCKESANHFIDQIVKKRSQTLQTLSLSIDDSSEDPQNIPTKKIIANLKHLKSLRYLKIDLHWLPDHHQSLRQFLESLKHLKNLSLLRFDFDQLKTSSFPQRVVYSTGQKLQALSKGLKKISGLPKMKIKLSFSLLRVRNDEFLMSLRSFSQLESFASADITLHLYHFWRIQETILALKKSKSLSQLSLTLDDCIPDSQTGFKELQTAFKEIKPLKNLRIDLKTDCGITSSNLKELVPIFREIAQSVHLEMIFATSNFSLNLAFLKEMPNLRDRSLAIHAQFPGLLRTLCVQLCALFIAIFMIFNVFKSFR